MNTVLPIALEGVKELYNIYKGTNNNIGKKMGVNASEIRFLGAYNNKGKRLGTYYKK